jgi:hypothetical protein
MTGVARQKKPTPAERRMESRRQARMSAPLLRDLQPSVTHVRVELGFEQDSRLAATARSFTTYPPARAHFVYGCAFGDCNGIHDLDDVVLGLLKSGASHASGVRRCDGHKSYGFEHGPACGLGLTYTVSVHYDASQPELARQPIPTG